MPRRGMLPSPLPTAAALLCPYTSDIIPTPTSSGAPSQVQFPPSSGHAGRSRRRPLPNTRKLNANLPMTMTSHPDSEEYVETSAERNARQLFESHPYQCARMVVDSILRGDGQPPLLRPNEQDINSDAFSYLFSPLFGTMHRGGGRGIDRPPSPAQPTNKSRSKKRTNEPAFFRKRRQSFKITVAYRGPSYCGWQIQPGHDLPSVQQTLMDILGPMMLTEPKAGTRRAARKLAAAANKKEETKEKKKKELNVRVCGRTDAGVSAVGQVCRVRTFATSEEDGVDAGSVMDAINRSARGREGSMRCVDVVGVGEDFHPTFGARCRAYAYLIDLEEEAATEEEGSDSEDGIAAAGAGLRPSHVPILDAMLRQLEGAELDYHAFSYGKVKTTTTLCTLLRCRATIVECVVPPPLSEEEEMNEESSGKMKRGALCIELVGDRFLRRMVRILVATAVQETLRRAALGGQRRDSVATTSAMPVDTFLRDVCERGDRSVSAKAAPPDGLIFVGAEFTY